MRADVHMHTNFSHDSEATPEQMIEGAIQKGLEVIDLRANQEQASATGSATPRPEHFGIDTPFDPRLELSDYQFPTLNLLEDFGDQSQKIQDMEEELVANKDQIVNTLLNYGIAIDKKKIVQDEPIKSFGTFTLKAKLGYEITANISVHVSEG